MQRIVTAEGEALPAVYGLTRTRYPDANCQGRILAVVVFTNTAGCLPVGSEGSSSSSQLSSTTTEVLFWDASTTCTGPPSRTVYRGLDSCIPDHDASTGLTTYYYETFTVAPPALSGKSKGGVKPLSKGGVAGVVVAVLLVFIGSCAGLWYYCVKVLPPDEEEEPKKKGHEGLSLIPI